MSLADFLKKLRGTTRGGPPRVSNQEVFWSWLGAFLGVGLLGLLNQHLLPDTAAFLLVGSMGASAVLVYGAPRSPLAQPRNLVGGHVVSALIGVTSFQLLHGVPWLADASAVSLAIAAMHLTRTLHPPGGATALIAVIGGEPVHQLGYVYAVLPVGASALVLLAVGLVVNNLPATRRYPEVWW